MQEQFDTIIIGTGFAGAFFLAAYLETAPADARILVLERGNTDTVNWQIKHKTWASVPYEETFVNTHPDKSWMFNLAFGGGSMAWWGCVPRMLPNDFQLQSTFGVGTDWPLTYDELEPYYCTAEEMMAVAGPSEDSPFPRSRPYPQPPHQFSDPDLVLKSAYQDTYFQQPSARARIATDNRAKCCANGVCDMCPINARFSIPNELYALYNDPRVTLKTAATAQTIETSGGVASGVIYEHEGKQQTANGDLIILAANALFNPHILMRSGFSHPLLGKRLNEQVSQWVYVDLAAIDNYQGSTSIVGHGYMLYDGPHRAERAACLIESWNVPYLSDIRIEAGRWRQHMRLKIILEDIPDEANFVAPNADNPALPETHYTTHSTYTQNTLDILPEVLPQILNPIPVEGIRFDDKINPSEAHILGTTVMGNDPETSIVDRYLKHHEVRNLLVLGSSVYPTCSPANPTLTLSALSLWAADHL
jgi:choline dehydrogenase-like flavoprotein